MRESLIDLAYVAALRERCDMTWLGVMSGTSGDGIDVARVRLRESEQSPEVLSVEGGTYPFSTRFHSQLGAWLVQSLGSGEGISVEEAARWHARLGEEFAAACVAAIGDYGAVDAIALSGHTFAHLPRESLATTLQLGDAAVVAERTGLPVIFDFRASDVARGGEGAPLVPAADRILLGSATEELLILNLGGISNLTLLPPGGIPLARDCGPCNLILNEIVRRRSDGALHFDEGGDMAARGRADAGAVERWLQHPFLCGEGGSSTGREEFGEEWVQAHTSRLNELSLEDALASVVAWIATSIFRSWQQLARAAAPDQIWVGGGGAHHRSLMGAISKRFGVEVARLTPHEHGVSADLREAAAFAILGQEWLQGRAASFPSTTNCVRAGTLGALRLP